MKTAIRFSVAAVSFPLLWGCTDYKFAVECSAVFNVTLESDSTVRYLQEAAHRDAIRKAERAGKQNADVARDIMLAEPVARRRLAGKRPVTNDEFSRCSALYD